MKNFEIKDQNRHNSVNIVLMETQNKIIGTLQFITFAN